MKTFVTLSLAILAWLLPASSSSAVVVSWGFRGVVSRYDNPTGNLPGNIAVGTPFTGVIRYDLSFATGPDADPNPNRSVQYFTNVAGLSITVNVAGHIITTTNQLPGDSTSDLTIENNISDRDYVDVGFPYQTVRLNGAPLPGPVTFGGLSLGLTDATKSMFSNDSVPTNVPILVVEPDTSWVQLNLYDSVADVFRTIQLEIGELYADSKVLITTTRLPGNQLRLSWPVSATGLTLQFATSLTTQNLTTEPTAVVDTATEHTITVSTAGQPKFFRLVKLPVSK